MSEVAPGDMVTAIMTPSTSWSIIGVYPELRLYVDRDLVLWLENTSAFLRHTEAALVVSVKDVHERTYAYMCMPDGTLA